jgi:hypothetical protein
MREFIKDFREEWKIIAILLGMVFLLSWAIPMATVYLFTTDGGFYEQH